MGDTAALRFIEVLDTTIDEHGCFAELRLSEAVDDVRGGFIEAFDLDPGGRVQSGEVERVTGDVVRLRAATKGQLGALVRALQEWGLAKAIERQAALEREIADLRAGLVHIVDGTTPPWTDEPGSL